MHTGGFIENMNLHPPILYQPEDSRAFANRGLPEELLEALVFLRRLGEGEGVEVAKYDALIRRYVLIDPVRKGGLNLGRRSHDE